MTVQQSLHNGTLPNVDHNIFTHRLKYLKEKANLYDSWISWYNEGLLIEENWEEQIYEYCRCLLLKKKSIINIQNNNDYCDTLKYKWAFIYYMLVVPVCYSMFDGVAQVYIDSVPLESTSSKLEMFLKRLR